jgi:Rps23 Pro-64 3,4-dihydroxylase Tpa1-like proline 4-hydroxylase
MNYTLWKTNLVVEDNFFHTDSHRKFINYNSEQLNTIQGQDETSFAQQFPIELQLIDALVTTYAIDMGIDPLNLELANVQFGKLTAYTQDHVANHLYEPHHDMVERSIISAIYYIDSDYTETGAWVGGELTIYNELTFASYPNNTVNILPKPNRLIIFPGFLTHRVKPYFGLNPRRTVVMGWKIKDTPADTATFI